MAPPQKPHLQKHGKSPCKQQPKPNAETIKQAITALSQKSYTLAYTKRYTYVTKQLSPQGASILTTSGNCFYYLPYPSIPFRICSTSNHEETNTSRPTSDTPTKANRREKPQKSSIKPKKQLTSPFKPMEKHKWA
jgi:hypothetical protein